MTETELYAEIKRLQFKLVDAETLVKDQAREMMENRRGLEYLENLLAQIKEIANI